MAILLAAHPTAGHTSALRAIGVELIERGHDVGFALMRTRLPFSARWPEPIRFAAELPASVASDGIDVLALRPPPAGIWHAARLPRTLGQDELAVAIELFTSGTAAQARQIAEHGRRIGASVIVGDYLMPAAMLAAQLADLPYVAVYHSALPFPTDGAAPFGTSLPASAKGTAAWRAGEARLDELGARFDARVTSAARSLRLPPPDPGLLRRPISRDLNVLATTPELEPGLRPLPGPVVMTGPCLRASTTAAAIDPAGLPSTRPLAYISLGTVFNDKPGVYGTLIDGARAAGFSVIVSAGASADRLASLQSDDVRIYRQVPQVALLEHVDVVITHGGNNTVQESLAAGRPMVVIPFGGDQWANARRVERLGVGASIDPAALTSHTVRSALSRAREPESTAAAQALADSLARYGGTVSAADAIVDLAAGRR
ncbi:MAG: glycosyltransferase [Actinomycetota bacterium]